MLYDDLAKELRGPMADCCMTDLYCPSSHRYFGTVKIGSRKWSALIGQKDYAIIRPVADGIYKLMDSYGCVLPLVQKHHDGIKMEYRDDDRFVTFYIRPGEDVGAVAETTFPKVEPVYVSTKPDLLGVFCKTLAEFLTLRDHEQGCDDGAGERV